MADREARKPIRRGIRLVLVSLVGLMLLFNVVATREHLAAIFDVDRSFVSVGGYTSRTNVFVASAVGRFFKKPTRFLVPPLHRVAMPALKKTKYPHFFFRLTRPYGMKFLNLFSYPVQTRIKRYDFVLKPGEFQYLKKASFHSTRLTISKKTITAFYADKYRNGFYFAVDVALHLVRPADNASSRDVSLFLYMGKKLHFVVAPANWRTHMGAQ
jgi:hypothetical protein